MAGTPSGRGGRGGRGRGAASARGGGGGGGSSSSRRGNGDRSRGNGRGGRGGRRGFSGALQRDDAVSASAAPGESSLDKGKAPQGTHGDANDTTEAFAAQSSTDSLNASAAAPITADDTAEMEVCFICAEPVKLYSVAQCNHRTCHVCAVRLRALYKKLECTFCKAPTDALIFTSDPAKNFLDFHADEIPYRDERLNVYFETQQARDETLILLHFNCPDETCEYAASNWTDLRGHARAEHGRYFCDLCTHNSKIFVHEHALYKTAELTNHIRESHKHCEFCKRNFYSDDDLYIHMRDKHEQCFICKKYEETRDEYQRDYPALERHFRKQHYLCEAKECLEQKFVVFESEMDFKAHQVAEHGGELTSKEKRDALRVTANFSYNQASAQARAGQSSGGSSGATSRGRPRNDLPAESSAAANRDPLGVSILAQRSHVPGSGGAADHQSRRAMFGSQLSSSRQRKDKSQEAVEADTAAAEAARIERHQTYMAQVSELLDQSDSKMYAFRAQVKMYHAGETSASDLIDSVRSIVQDQGKMQTIVNGLVDLLEDKEQKQDVMTAWTASQIEQTHFPTLGGVGSSGSTGTASGAFAKSYANANANLSSAQRGRVRSIKNNAAANNRSVWANVERAAGGMMPRTTRVPTTTQASATSAFPSLGGASSTSSRNSHIPGSAAHSAAKGASVTPWAGANAATRGSAISTSGSSTPRPFSVDVAPSLQGSNRGSVRSNAAAFPSLPTNAAAAQLAAQKRALFEHKRQQQTSSSGTRTPANGQSSGAATPRIWRPADFGRVDAYAGDYDGDLDIDALAGRLDDAAAMQSPRWAPAGASGASSAPNGSGNATPGGGGQKGKKQKQKQVLVTMGGVHRGG